MGDITAFLAVVPAGIATPDGSVCFPELELAGPGLVEAAVRAAAETEEFMVGLGGGSVHVVVVVLGLRGQGHEEGGCGDEEEFVHVYNLIETRF